MDKIVKRGRWGVAILLAFQGFAVLFIIEAIVIFVAIELQERMLFPALMAEFVSAPLLACAWGIVKVRRWAYRLAMAVALLEGLAVILTVLASRAKVTWVVLGGVDLHIGPGLIFSLLLVSLSLVWLLLPEVRSQYLHKVTP